MDLALHLGQPVHSLARTMPESEFVDWQRYAARRMLPMRRIELYLAQIALIGAGAAGAKNVTLRDFLFDPEDDDGAGPGDDLEDAAEFFGFAPRPKQEQTI